MRFRATFHAVYPAAFLLFHLHLLLSALLLTACSNRGDGISVVLTPLDSGVYRADMEGRRGLLLFSAHPAHMSFAYDTALGGLYLAWNGPVDSVRTGLKGITYYRHGGGGPIWSVRRGGDTVTPVVRFRDFHAAPGTLTIHLDLILPGIPGGTPGVPGGTPGGDTIRVREFLVHDDHYGDHALETEFDFAGIDTGMAVVLSLAGKAGVGPWPPLWSASVGRLEGEAGREEYVQENDGVGLVKVTFTGSSSL